MDWFFAAVAIVSVVAGATASVVGFGIGSLLTPLLSVRFGTDVAVALVAIPHAAGGLLRGWRLRRAIDRAVVLRFGLLSAAGGLAGALLHGWLGGPTLTRTLGALLVLTSVAGLTGFTSRWHPHGAVVWILGGVSGFFGGVVGNQGGLRAAALSAFGLAPVAFVATSTVTGVLVDVARTPIYVWRMSGELAVLFPWVIALTAGVVVGTLAGERLLFGLAPERYRAIVSAAIGIVGFWLLMSA